ncbi:MAG: sodium:solute symporter family protein [Verrucomicrobiales bacterium]
MKGLHLLDFSVIILYLLGITTLGVWVGRRVKGDSDFFMPRRFGKGMMMMHAFGTGTASDQAVVVASGTFRNGLSGIWFQWLWLFNTPFYWLLAPIFRRLRALTTADVYRLRFGPSVSVLFAVVGIGGLAVKIGLMLKGAGALIDAGTGGAVSATIAIPIVALLFVIYGVAGGMGAAIITDYIQGILTVLFSFILLPFILNVVGGLEGIRATVDAPRMMSLVAPEGINTFFITTFALLSLAGIVAQPFIMSVCANGRTEFDGRFGFVVGNLLKRICTAAWALTGIGALAYYLQQGTPIADIDPDRVYGQVAQTFLPEIFPGILGLFIAALLAGVMSSCDSFMISSAGLFTENLYKPLAPGRSEKHYVTVGRIVSLAVVLGGVIVAFKMPNVVAGLKTWLKIAPMLGLAFWMGLFWRRFNAAGAWACTLTGFAFWWLSIQQGFVKIVAGSPFTERFGMIVGVGDELSIYEPWQILFYLSAAALAGIFASLLTQRTPKEQTERFHDLIRTPVSPGEVISQPCCLPEGVTPAERPRWFAGTDFEIAAPSKTSFVGFLLAWIAVAAMIGAFAWLCSP